MTEFERVGRRPFFYCEVDFKACANVYGVAPCTATGSPGEECYNTFATCQDLPNYVDTIKTYRFSSERTQAPSGINALPVIKGEPLITPVRLEPDKGVGQRGAINLTLAEFPGGEREQDPYILNRQFAPGSGFFSRLRRRNAFYHNQPLRFYSGYIDDNNDLADEYERLYFLTSFDGEDRNGHFNFIAKDILKFTQDKNAIVPPQAGIMLNEDLNRGENDIDIRPGDGDRLRAHPNISLITIDKEVIFFLPNNVVGNRINNVIRGWLDTSEAETHDSGMPIKTVISYNVNVVDAIYDLLVNYANIDPIYIPYNNDPGNPDEWDQEKEIWLNSHNINNQVLFPPDRVDRVLAELCSQFSISLWWNEREQKVKLSGSNISLGLDVPKDYTDDNNILVKSLNVVEDINNRFTQFWIYYDQYNQTTDKDNVQNYRSLSIRVNVDAENEHAYNEVNVKFLLANWLDSGNNPIISTISRKLLAKDLLQNYFVTFHLDAKDAPELWTGQFCLLKSDSVVNERGEPVTQRVQITSVRELMNGHKFEYIGISKVFMDPNIVGQFIAIAQNGLPDYSAASEDQKDDNFYITYGDAPFPDGREPYRIAGDI